MLWDINERKKDHIIAIDVLQMNACFLCFEPSVCHQRQTVCVCVCVCVLICVSVCDITFTFSHLADAFIQSDLHMCDLQCIHILHLHIYTDGTLHIRSN